MPVPVDEKKPIALPSTGQIEAFLAAILEVLKVVVTILEVVLADLQNK